jgi:ankyrin repeat protein
VYCQLKYLSDCLPGRIRHVLDELPDTLDGTYERTLQEINNTNWEFAQRLLQCVAVVSRPLLIEELADILAIDFKAGPIPKYREDWRVEDSVEAVLSTCSTLLVLVNVSDSVVVQFAHFSVKEFLTSLRFAEKRDTISRRYHISPKPAHSLVAKACLGILLYLEQNVTRESLTEFPLTQYAAEHWFEHARFEGVSRTLEEGMKQLLECGKPHLAVWLWIHDPTVDPWYWRPEESAGGPLPPRGTALHYVACCGLDDVVKVLVAEHPEDVNAQTLDQESTPLHLASGEGHVEVARILAKHGADTTAQTKDGETPLHWASDGGHIELARILIEHGADAAAQTKDGETPLHRASDGGHLELARLLIEHGADVAAQTKDGETPLHRRRRHAQTKGGETPLHRVSEGGHVELARLLIEHSADAAAQTKDGETPLHRASRWGHAELARLLIEHGAETAVQTEDGETPLHRASDRGQVELTRLLIKHGADAAAQTKDGETPLHRASDGGYVELVRFLIEHGTDVAAQTKNGETPLYQVSRWGYVEPARLLIEHGADAAAQTEDGETPLYRVSGWGHVELARLLIEHGANTAASTKDGETPLHRASGWGYVEGLPFSATTISAAELSPKKVEVRIGNSHKTLLHYTK